MGREVRCKQITLACARSVSATLGLPLLTAHTAQALGCSSGNRLRPALGCMHLPGLSRSGSGTQVVLRGADSAGPAFCALPRSKQLRSLTSAVAATCRLSRPCCSVFWVCCWRPFSGGWGLFLKTMICFAGCLMSSASIQKLFCGIYSVLKCSFDEFVRQNVVSPSYSSAILGPAPRSILLTLGSPETFKPILCFEK